MSEIGDYFKDVKEISTKKKHSNIQKSTQLLIDTDVDFTVHNSGRHLILTTSKGVIDFWPSTGRWIPREEKNYYPEGRGIFKLLHYIKKRGQENES